jgi:hypothetical protein
MVPKLGALAKVPRAREMVAPEVNVRLPLCEKLPFVNVSVPLDGIVLGNPSVTPPELYICTLFGPFVTGHSIVVDVCAVVCPEAPYLKTALVP